MPLPRRPLALLGLAACAAVPAGAAGVASGPPSDRSVTELERAAFVALPAIYQVRAEFAIVTARQGTRVVTIGRKFVIAGTAFGVGPGRVVTAKHVVDPSDQRLFDELSERGPELRNLDPGATRITRRLLGVVLTPARPAGMSDARVEPFAATVRRTSDGVSDIALLATADERAPTLALSDLTLAGTPIATVGFGGRTDGAPGVGLGRIGPLLDPIESDNDTLRAITTEVVRGDSGGPVMAVDGTVRGMVVRRRNGDFPAAMVDAGAIRALMRADGLVPGRSDTELRFADAMARFWARDYRGAEVELRGVARLRPGTGWIADEASRAAAFASAAYRLERVTPWRLPLVAVGVAALLLAVALAQRSVQLPFDDEA